MHIANVLYLQINLFSFLICLVLLIHHRKSDSEVIGRKTFDFILMFVCTILILDSISWLLEGRSGFVQHVMYEFVLDMVFILQMIPPLGMLLYSKDLNVAELAPKKKLLYFAPVIIGVIIIFVNIFYPCVFYLSSSNVYARGPAFYIVGGVPAMYLLCAFIVTVRAWRSAEDGNAKKMKRSIMIFLLMPMCGVGVQFLVYGIEAIWMMSSIGMVYLYINVQSQREEEMRQQMMQSRVSIMLSQIQPHFLYNSLNTIQLICKKDPETASDAIRDFSLFLRGNMDSLKSTEPIHFSRELEHTKKYLNLETLRFGDKLSIEYDIEEEDFFLPALTIQPIIENAVKYGVGSREEGGTVTISTCRKGSDILITIKDDGIGFDADSLDDMPTQYDGRTHIGLQNVRDRVETMCGGRMEITSVKNEGTEVTIVLPENEEGSR